MCGRLHGKKTRKVSGLIRKKDFCRQEIIFGIEYADLFSVNGETLEQVIELPDKPTEEAR